MGPGTHDLLPYSEFSEKNVNMRADGPNWKTALHTEKMAKIPHLLFKDTYYKRKEHVRQTIIKTYRRFNSFKIKILFSRKRD